MERWGETILGAIVSVVAIGFFVFAANQAGASNNGGYDLVARFQRVDGIAVGSDVRVSGVKVGVVKAVSLDPDTYMAQLTLALDRNVKVLDESTASIASDGLLGGAYVRIEPAGMEPLAAGAEIPNTNGSIDLITLFSGLMSQGQNGQNGQSGNSGQSQNEGAHP